MRYRPHFIDLVGEIFGRLAVLREAGTNASGNVLWECLCSCGSSATVIGTLLRRGDTRSCGCLFAEGNARTHGGSRTRIYGVFKNMLRRCTNPHDRSWKYYGGRGITVCDEWRGRGGFGRFRDHVKQSPGPGYTIERIDNNRGYSPGNVRWATQTEQMRNRRNTVFIVVGAERRPLAEWLEKLGVSRSTYKKRRRLGWTIQDALTRPRRKIRSPQAK